MLKSQLKQNILIFKGKITIEYYMYVTFGWRNGHIKLTGDFFCMFCLFTIFNRSTKHFLFKAFCKIAAASESCLCRNLKDA